MTRQGNCNLMRVVTISHWTADGMHSTFSQIISQFFLFASGTKILRHLSHIRCSIFTVQSEPNCVHYSPRFTTWMMSPCKLMDFFRPLATNNCLLIRPDFPIVFEQEALSLSRLSSVIVHLKLNNLMIHQRVAC